MEHPEFGEHSPSTFETLPEEIQNKVFSYLKYADIARMRFVDAWFNEKCTNLLHNAFFNLKDLLETEYNNVMAEITTAERDCNDAEERRRRISDIQLKYKIVQILRSEYLALSTVCERYIKHSVYNFTNGKLLDYFYEILKHGVNPLESNTTMQLFLLNEEFMDDFEEFVEPGLLKGPFSPWFGVKIVDFLDLCLSTNYYIKATCENGVFQISARYEILNSINSSKLSFAQGVGCIKNLQKFTKYVRNQMRWHNLFYYVDSSYDLMNARRQEKSFSKFCLNPSDKNDEAGSVYNNNEITADKFNKTFNRRIGNPCSDENIAYAIELQCSKNSVPERLQRYVGSMVEQTDAASDDEPVTFETFICEAATNYNFHMSLKLVLPIEGEESATDKLVQIFHNRQLCELTEKSKEVPL